MRMFALYEYLCQEENHIFPSCIATRLRDYHESFSYSGHTGVRDRLSLLRYFNIGCLFS